MQAKIDLALKKFEENFKPSKSPFIMDRYLIIYKITGTDVIAVFGSYAKKRVYRIIEKALGEALKRFGPLNGYIAYQSGDSQKIYYSDFPILMFAISSSSSNAIAIPDNTYFEHDVKENYGFDNILNWDQIKEETIKFNPEVQNDIYFKGREMGRKAYNIRKAIKKACPTLNINYDSLTNYESPWECKKHAVLLNLPGASEWSNRLKHVLITGRTVIDVRAYIRTAHMVRAHNTFIDYFAIPNHDFIQYDLFIEMPRSKIPTYDDSGTHGYLCGDNFCVPKYNPTDYEMTKYLEDKNDSIPYVEEFNEKELKLLNEFMINVRPNEEIAKNGFNLANSITVNDCYYFLYKAMEICVKYKIPESFLKGL